MKTAEELVNECLYEYVNGEKFISQLDAIDCIKEFHSQFGKSPSTESKELYQALEEASDMIGTQIYYAPLYNKLKTILDKYKHLKL